MLQSVTIPDSRVPEVLYKYFPPEAVDDSAKWIPKVSLSRCCVSGGEIVRCECCRKMVREDYLGPDYGASHFFCDECLSLLEIGQGLAEDPVFAAEWKQMLKESEKKCDAP